ncbi:OmpA family protein [Spiribacter sp. C176]|uniref:OmpA family protein n=1 Tax=Spiribacter salilacus TaxID=2664894 RepID=A0A6N7QSC1_9GAMM|nr:peptidoglycan-binding protein [Spiribacter salilacus]MRH78303.1 OmpA family protein [Spiribacter salilacus]
MLGSSRRNRASVNIWPGFVDALATVLLAFVFMLLLFVVAQLFMSTQLTDRNRALEALQAELSEMADALALSRGQQEQLEDEVSNLYAELHATLSQRDQAQADLALSEEALAAAREEIAVGEDALTARLIEIASLQQDIAALREVRETLEAEIAERTRELGAERDRSMELAAELADAEERTVLAQREIEAKDMRIRDLVMEVADRQEALNSEQRLSASAEARVEALRRQLRALRTQISALAETLRIEEQTVAEQQAEIDTLVERLNIALAEEVQELTSYRSEFFGRLREVLGDIEEIEIIGDRFRFQSELFFETASAELGAEGEVRLGQVASVLQRVAERIPDEIEWVLQVEGHTDRRPINTPEFPSNWELSSARAQSIVYFLIEQGIPAERLSAVGYGEFQPVADGDDAESFARNRRIELRLTSR